MPPPPPFSVEGSTLEEIHLGFHLHYVQRPAAIPQFLELKKLISVLFESLPLRGLHPSIENTCLPQHAPSTHSSLEYTQQPEKAKGSSSSSRFSDAAILFNIDYTNALTDSQRTTQREFRHRIAWIISRTRHTLLAQFLCLSFSLFVFCTEDDGKL